MKKHTNTLASIVIVVVAVGVGCASESPEGERTGHASAALGAYTQWDWIRFPRLDGCLEYQGVGVPLATRLCDPTDVNQSFSVNSGTGQILTWDNNCVDDAGWGGAGSNVQAWPCTGGGNQSWTQYFDGVVTSFRGWDGNCITCDVSYGSCSMQPCFTGAYEQGNQLQYNDGTPYGGSFSAFAPTMDYKCMDVQAGINENGTPVQLWDCLDNANQLWEYDPGSGAIYWGLTGKCLDAPSNSPYNGTQVQVWDCNGWSNQQWRRVAPGQYVNGQSGKCLEVQGIGNTANGAPIQIWDCWGGDNQEWYAK